MMLDREYLVTILEYFPLTGKFLWICDKRYTRKGKFAGYASKAGYRQIRIDGKLYYAHRLAWLYMTGQFPKHEIDHINGIRSDDRWINLREVPRVINCQNQHSYRSDNRSGYLGVVSIKGSSKNPWVAFIRIAGKSTYLGCFATALEAHQAYLDAKRKYHIGCTI